MKRSLWPLQAESFDANQSNRFAARIELRKQPIGKSPRGLYDRHLSFHVDNSRRLTHAPQPAKM
jgi:hypothetical protein